MGIWVIKEINVTDFFLRGEKNYKISSVPAYIKSEFLSHDHVYHLSSVRQNPRTAEMEFSKRA